MPLVAFARVVERGSPSGLPAALGGRISQDGSRATWAAPEEGPWRFFHSLNSTKLGPLYFWRSLRYPDERNLIPRILTPCARSPSDWVANRCMVLTGGARHPSNSLINSRIPIGTLFYWVKGAPPHVGFALGYFFPRALSNSLTFLP